MYIYIYIYIYIYCIRKYDVSLKHQMGYLMSIITVFQRNGINLLTNLLTTALKLHFKQILLKTKTIVL